MVLNLSYVHYFYRRIMYLEKNRVFSGYDIEWEVELKEISDVKNEQNKLVISLKASSDIYINRALKSCHVTRMNL